MLHHRGGGGFKCLQPLIATVNYNDSNSHLSVRRKFIIFLYDVTLWARHWTLDPESSGSDFQLRCRCRCTFDAVSVGTNFFRPVPKLESATFFGEASKPFSGSKNFFFNGFRLLLQCYSADMARWHCQSVVQKRLSFEGVYRCCAIAQCHWWVYSSAVDT